MKTTRITQDERRQLLRLVHGELTPAAAAALRQRIAQEPPLAVAYHELEATWAGLALPPVAAVPPGFAQRTKARVLERATESPLAPPRWATAPGSVRAVAAAALVAGVLLGVGVGIQASDVLYPPVTATAPVDDLAREVAADLATSSLAEQYWQLLESDELPEPES
jgi:anti-sigma factor RsiW